MAAEFITKEDLQIFKTELLSEIRSLLGKGEKQTGEWLRSSQARAMLHISPNTLQAMRISGKLKSTKVGSIFYYKLQDIIDMLEGVRKK
jgi:hypothetical protein